MEDMVRQTAKTGEPGYWIEERERTSSLSYLKRKQWPPNVFRSIFIRNCSEREKKKRRKEKRRKEQKLTER
jgi:hypothetical protein